LSIIQAIILGIIQGITEFLPISSTGHLTLVGKIMKLISEENPERWTAFIAVIQLGTLLAVIIYFFKELLLIIKEFLRDNWFNRVKFKEQSDNSKMGWYLVIATIPVAVFGLVFKHVIEGVLTKSLFVISGSLITLAVILAIAERFGRFNRTSKDLKWTDALYVGLAQVCALIPGSSRSGTTITAGLFLGFDRETAARFSFLMSIPAVAASGLLEFYQSMKYVNKDGFVLIIVSTIISAIVGYISIGLLLRYLKTKSMMIFIVYRIFIGVLILVLITLGIVQA
jgi:undecaprenyl-diphosphatase